MTSEQRLTPQLAMIRDDLSNLPAMELPEGYGLRHYEAGDDRGWELIIAESFQRPVSELSFQRAMSENPAFKPQRVLFVTHERRLVATASAWYVPKHDKQTGYIHMVGVRPGHQGKRLGYWASLAALHRLAEEGFTRAFLQTDDFRLAAVKLYLKLGFKPVLLHENQRQRWRDVFEKLGLQEMESRFASILTGPIADTQE